MHESSLSFSNLESPAPGQHLAAGSQVIRGWAWPKAGGHFVDARVRINGRIFPGIHGLPRADLAAHFQTGREFALAGFAVPVLVPAGEITLSLEILSIEGKWREIQRERFLASGTAASPATEPGQTHVLRWHDFTRGVDRLLRLRRARPDASWPTLARELADSLPRVQDPLMPPLPFSGHADEPAIVNRAKFGRVPVVGYLLHATQPIRQLWASVDLQDLQPLRLGRATANLAEHFPGNPAATTAGYEGYVDVPAQLPNPIAVRLYAATDDQPLALVQVRRTCRHEAELEKFPYADVSPGNFAAATGAWRAALLSRGLPLADETELAPALAELEADYLRDGRSNARGPRDAAAARMPLGPAAGLRDVIFASHNLNLEGAPLFLLDLVGAFAAAGIKVTVVTPEDGPLRPRFAALGARIIVADVAPVFAAEVETQIAAALDGVGRAVDFSAADLVITNTFTAFWAVHAAKRAGSPVLTYVHESTSLAAFYRERVSPAVLARAEEALGLADVVTFTSEATLACHSSPQRPLRAVVTPGWVDLAQIDRWLAGRTRAEVRAQFGVGPEELLVTNVGTVCDRKGQIGFVRAVELFRRRHPTLAARVRVVLLGGRDSPFDAALQAVLRQQGTSAPAVHPETPDFLPYYAAADLTVCSSHEESSPRVVFEAMACGTPLLASDIPGIREIARSGEEAVLVTAGDTSACAEALAEMLAAPAERSRLAQAARRRVESRHAAELILPRHLALATAVARGQPAP